MKKYNHYIYTIPIISTAILVSGSCSRVEQEILDLKTFDEEDMQHSNNEEMIINGYKNWYNSLTLNSFESKMFDDPYNPGKKVKGNINAISTSEKQSFELYLNEWGDFWNESLHKRLEPHDVERKFLSTLLRTIESGFLPDEYYAENNKKFLINGDGYKYILQALNKDMAVAPTDMRLYHGVEYQEIEFYDQLKNFIKQDKNKPNLLDYSDCVGKTITSYGFISTSIIYDKKNLTKFCLGENWTNNNKKEPPLKEPFLFIIDVKKGTHGLAYVSNPFKMVTFTNTEHQIMINKDKSYFIKKWERRRDSFNNAINVFWLDLI